MDKSDDLLENFADGVTTLILNRPESLNALTYDMVIGLCDILTRLADDPKTRCVVLTGAGNAFCAGGNVKGFAKMAKDDSNSAFAGCKLEEQIRGLRQRTEVVRLLHEMPKPTLAVMPGAAAGAGLSLAMACDFRIALDTAKITTAFAKIGASGDYGSSYFMPHLVGVAKARELFFTADVISGREAYEIGLVSKVADADTFAAVVKAFIARLVGMPTVAVGYMKQNLNLAMRGSLSDLLDQEAGHMVRSLLTEDHKNAAIAFVEKRKPEFKGY